MFINSLCSKTHHNSHRIYKITQKIIEQKRYSRLVYLDFDNVLRQGDCNKKVNNLNHLADTLEYLSCPWDCGVDQNGISQLKKITTLLCGSNVKIKCVKHLVA